MSAFAREIGPRKVDGRYYDGYWGDEYTVVSIETDRATWPVWQITIRRDDGREVSHCTAWDPEKDRVIS